MGQKKSKQQAEECQKEYQQQQQQPQNPEIDYIFPERRLDQVPPRRQSWTGFFSFYSFQKHRRHSTSEVDLRFPGRSLRIKAKPDMFKDRCEVLMRAYGYDLADEIQSGKYGTVYQCFHRKLPMKSSRFESNKKLACKLVEFYQTSVVERLTQLADEINVLVTVDHDNCMKAIEIFNFYDYNLTHIYPKCSFIIMPLADGDLIKLANIYGWIHEDDAKRIISQVAHGLQYLHENHIAHLDIKLDNIFYFRHINNDGSGYQFKIGDFGFAFYASRKRGEFEELSILTSPRGTWDYAPPEIHRNIIAKHFGLQLQDYNPFKADIFYLGIAIVNFLSTMQQKQINRRVKLYRNNPYFCQWFNALLPHRSKELIDLIRQMTRTNHNQRPNVDTVLQHNWFKGVKYESRFMKLKYIK